MEELWWGSGGVTAFLWRLGLANRGPAAAERLPTGFRVPVGYGQTQSPSAGVLPGTPPSSFSFQPTE